MSLGQSSRPGPTKKGETTKSFHHSDHPPFVAPNTRPQPNHCPHLPRIPRKMLEVPWSCIFFWASRFLNKLHTKIRGSRPLYLCRLGLATVVLPAGTRLLTLISCVAHLFGDTGGFLPFRAYVQCIATTFPTMTTFPTCRRCPPNPNLSVHNFFSTLV